MPITLKYGASPSIILPLAYQAGQGKYRNRQQEFGRDLLLRQQQFAQQQAMLGQQQFFRQQELDQRLGLEREMFGQQLSQNRAIAAQRDMTAQQRVTYNAQQKANDRAFQRGRPLPFKDAGLEGGGGGVGQPMIGGGQAPLMLAGPEQQQQQQQYTPEQLVALNAQQFANERARRAGRPLKYQSAEQGVFDPNTIAARNMKRMGLANPNQQAGPQVQQFEFSGTDYNGPEQVERFDYENVPMSAGAVAGLNESELEQWRQQALTGQWELTPEAQKRWTKIHDNRAKIAIDETMDQPEREQRNQQLDKQELSILRTGQRKQEIDLEEQFNKDTLTIDPKTGKKVEPGQPGVRMRYNRKNESWERVDMGEEKEAAKQERTAEKEAAKQERIAEKKTAKEEKATADFESQISTDLKTAHERLKAKIESEWGIKESRRQAKIKKGDTVGEVEEMREPTDEEIVEEADKIARQRELLKQKRTTAIQQPAASVAANKKPITTTQQPATVSSSGEFFGQLAKAGAPPQPSPQQEEYLAKRGILANAREAPLSTGFAPPSQEQLQERSLGQQTAPPTNETQMPHVANDADWEKLPSGTEFIGPDGKKYRKN